MNAPIISGTFDPTVADNRPEIGPATSIPIVAGSMKMPACVTDAPKPNPVDLGSSTNSGTRTNDANMPKPSTNAARFVVHTGARRIMRMSTSGAELRVSAQTHAAASMTARTSRPIVRVDVQPQLEPWLTGTSNATSQPERNNAGTGSILPSVRIGDSGTNTRMPIV